MLKEVPMRLLWQIFCLPLGKLHFFHEIQSAHIQVTNSNRFVHDLQEFVRGIRRIALGDCVRRKVFSLVVELIFFSHLYYLNVAPVLGSVFIVKSDLFCAL